MGVKVFHNPSCSNCRGTLEILRERGVEPEIVEYLEEPPTKDELREVLRMLGVGPRAIIREKEPVYREAGLDDPGLDDEALLDAMVEHPILIQRPIVIADGKAVIGRPPEKVISLLEPGS